jgi:hypothetical protein
MGFGQFLIDTAKGALDDVLAKEARITGGKSQYERYDDKTLMKKFKESSGETRMSIGLVLKDRGYFKKD